MFGNYIMRRLPVKFAPLIFLIVCQPLLAATDQPGSLPTDNNRSPVFTPVIILAQGDDQGNVLQDSPHTGVLLLPATVDPENKEKRDKRCMTVCARWGEECAFIDRGAGGTSRKCRRACKQFTEECF